MVLIGSLGSVVLESFDGEAARKVNAQDINFNPRFLTPKQRFELYFDLMLS